MLRKQKVCLSKLVGAPVEFIEHGSKPKHPIKLECGHTICEACALHGGARIITCGACGTRTQLKSAGSADLPRNCNSVGQSAPPPNPSSPSNPSPHSNPAPPKTHVHTCMQAPNFCSFVEQISRMCDGCYKRLASLACLLCERFLCERCWRRVHHDGSLLSHVSLSVNSARLKPFSRCKMHRTKYMESYCQDCRQYVCPDCVQRKHNGSDHDVVSVAEKNIELLDRLKELQKDVEENMKRMQNTIQEVVALKETTEKSSNSDFSKETVEKLIQYHGMLQAPEEALRQKMKRQEANRRIDMDNILTQLSGQIQMINILFSDITAISDCETLLHKVSVEEYFPMLMDMKYAPSMLDRVFYNREGKFALEESSSKASNEENASAVVEVPKSSIQLVNIRGQTNSDLGHEADPERRSTPKNIAVSKGQIVSGTPGEPRSRARARLGHYSSLNLMRFPAARTHSLIAEGCSYGVHLSHVKDPGEFYVVRTTARKQQQRIERLAPTLVDRCGLAPRKLQKDELYLVECVLDRKWYRGRVIEVLTRRTPNEDSSVLIFNLDYGNTQVVPHSRLRVMPDLLQAEPAMALRCRLSECVPTNGRWCRQAAKMMIEMMKEGVVTMYVVRVLPDILEVDLSHKVTHPHVNELKKSMTTQYPLFFLPKVGSSFTGIITHVVSPMSMYMQKICIDTDYLMDLMERINTFYDMHNQKGYIYNPVIGMPCAAICTQDYLWYRAKIIDLPGHEKITVQYVDYGNEDTLSFKLVRKLKAEFRKFPPQAFLCTLGDVVDPQDRNWRLDPRTYMNKMSEEVFQVRVVAVGNNALDVQLKLDPSCSASARLQPSFIIFGKKPRRPFFRIRPSALAGLNFESDIIPDTSESGKAAKLMELYKNSIRIEENEQVNEEPTKDEENEPLPAEELDEKIGEEVGMRIKILKVTSPSEIFVSIESFLPRMQELDRELQEFYMFNVAKKNTPWVPGTHCAILSYSHGKWLRGYVQEVLGNDMIKVEYFDMIGSEEVPTSSLRTLDQHFLSYPMGSVKCHLDGINKPETDWSEQIKDRLVSELQKHDKIYMTKRGKIEEYTSLPIKLWVKIKAEAEGEKGTSSEKWVVLNELIESQRSQVPEKANVQETPGSGERNEGSEEGNEESRERNEESGEKNEGSGENSEDAAEESQGSSDEDEDNYFLDENYLFVEKCTLDENDFKLNTAVTPKSASNTDANGNQNRPCDWVQQQSSTIKYFVGEPTHVDNNGYVYLHDMERDGAALEVLQYSLYQFYKDTAPDPADTWAVNDICVARYYVDNCWYRGKILEVKDRLYRVYFVDFGHVETCSGSWLRRSTTFIDTPTLARKYELYGVYPISETGEWPPEVIDKIYETIIEKRCNVTVVEKEAGATPKIYLRICENDQDLAEYLVTLGIATFGRELDYMLDDSLEPPKGFFEERFNDVEIFPVAPVTQAYNSGYRSLDIPTVSFPFPIKVTTVKEYHICANIVDDDTIYPRLRRNIGSLQRLTDQMQILGDQQPLLNNVKPGIACLSLYGITGTWHRAEIEGVDPRKDLIRVHYVDYGYTEYVTRERIRTILPRWFDIPRMALNFKLYRFKKNPEVRRKVYLSELTRALAHPDLMVRIMQKCKDYYEVEIRRKNATELVYQKLIDDGLLLPLEEDEIDYFDGFEFDDDDEEEDEERVEEVQEAESNQEAEEREGPDEREGPEERQGAEECNGPAECEGSEDFEGSDEFEGSEDMDASDDDEEDEEEEEVDFEVEEVEEEEEEGEGEDVEGVEDEEEVEELEEVEEEEEEEEEGVVAEENIEIEVD